MDTPSFERAALEADMKLLVAEIKNQRERPEMKDASGKEVLKEALLIFPNLEKSQNKPLAPSDSSSGSVTTANSNSPLPDYAQNAPAEVKLEIEYLIDLALKKGIGAAFAAAGKSSYFVQDAFHDALTGRLYSTLKKEGIVE